MDLVAISESKISKMPSLKEIENIFKNHTDPSKAGKMSAYMRNNFDFYGINAGERKELSKNFLREAKTAKTIYWQLLTELFSHNFREMNYLGMDILKAQSHLLTMEDFDKLVALAQIRPWWDTIDNIDGVVGGLGNARDFEEKILKLAVNDNFWLRRIAIGHQRKYKEKTKTDLLAKIIIINLNIPFKDKDEEFFINKAIGWALREYSKTNPAWVREFLQDQQKNLPNLSIREASKYLQ